MCPKDFTNECIINTVGACPLLCALKMVICRNDGSRQRAEFRTRVSGCQPVAQRSAAARLHPGLLAAALRAQNSAGLRPPDFKTLYFTLRHSYFHKLPFGAAFFATHVEQMQILHPIIIHSKNAPGEATHMPLPATSLSLLVFVFCLSAYRLIQPMSRKSSFLQWVKGRLPRGNSSLRPPARRARLHPPAAAR